MVFANSVPFYPEACHLSMLNYVSRVVCEAAKQVIYYKNVASSIKRLI